MSLFLGIDTSNYTTSAALYDSDSKKMLSVKKLLPVKERMAVVVRKSDMKKFIAAAAAENLEATKVADVMAEPRLKMKWNGKVIVDLSREFLNSNGAEKHTTVQVSVPVTVQPKSYTDCPDSWYTLMTNLNVCSQKGLVERFDSTIGAGTVLMPYGGKYQLTPTQAMAAKIPVLKGQTKTCSIMGWGYNPYVSDKSPYHGAICCYRVHFQGHRSRRKLQAVLAHIPGIFRENTE